MTIQEHIKKICLDYNRAQDWLEVSLKELDEIAYRIETEVMKIPDENALLNIPDISKKKIQ